MQSLQQYAPLIHHLESLIVLVDEDSRFLCSNLFTARLFGYKSVDAMLGDDAHHIHCAAAESASDFIEQDQYVLQQQKQLTIFDIHGYADNQTRILITKKSPISITEDRMGVLCVCTEVHSQSFSYMMAALLQSDQRYRPVGDKNRCYMMQNLSSQNKLSKREQDCVFYLVRGYSMKEIAQRLDISWRTVETYIRNIKFKWGCQRTSNIVEHAVTSGLLNYIPDTLQAMDMSLILDREHI